MQAGARFTVVLAVAVGLLAPAPSAADDPFLTERQDEEAYLQPAASLTADQLYQFKRGRIGFEARWVVFPYLGGEWGLGPLFIAERCSDCHVRAGRAGPPDDAAARPVATLVRLSLPGADANGAPKPHPVYGDQFQNRGLEGEDPRAHGHGIRVEREGDVVFRWEEHEVALADGEVVRLRKPVVGLENLRYGPLGEGVLTSVRNAQPIFGLGLLEAVPEDQILAIAERQRADGVNGRPNRVWDSAAGALRLGRFGWKANQPSVRQQIAAAFNGDLGVTSSLYPTDGCTPTQTACLEQPPGNNPEIIDQELTNLEVWTLGLAVPRRRNADDPEVQRGQALFEQARCAVCHVPSLTTGDHSVLPQLTGQEIAPYTDLLLHDMGDGLADGRPDFEAGPRDWRTQPLWGLGLAETVNGELRLLHDGRARSLAEAILWHGGEADSAKEAFRTMPKADRAALIKFLESL